MSAPVIEVGNYLNLSASGQVSATRGRLMGIFCASSTAGTAKVWDNTAGSGTVLVNTFSLVPGVYYPIPGKFLTGCYVTLGGTADITVFFLGE
jgi:4-hydroxybenzoate polyprenyltransferase